MNLLITGANGFLGSNLIKIATMCGHQVLAISRNNDNIKSIVENVEFLKQTENGYSNHKSEIVKFKPDVVVHFAWHGGNNYSDVNSISQFSVNIPMTTSLLDVFDQERCKPFFVGIGSFSEYGNLTKMAWEYQQEFPETYYGLSKNHAKEITKMFCKKNNMRWSWIRPCYVYGEGDISTRLLPKVINSLLCNTEVSLDDCNTIIDYTHISDFSSGVLSVIESEKTNGVYNICSSNEYNLRNLLQFVAENISKSEKLLKFDHCQSRTGFNKYFCGSNHRIKNHTKWVPKISIYDGLKNLIENTKKAL
jgi:nucleoside-diphosphate-sugar epimerase